MREKAIIESLEGMTQKLENSVCGLTFIIWDNYYNIFMRAVTLDSELIDYVKYANSLLNHIPFCANIVEETSLLEKKSELMDLIEQKKSNQSTATKKRKRRKSRKILSS